jgi:RHS repeat-associated protein
MYFIHPDHLNTPRMIANQAGTTVWRNDNTEPFGNSVPNGDPGNTGVAFDFPFSFPGQYADKETNINYNYYRDYDPGIGGYKESDRVGLRAGLNTYLYVRANPLRRRDPRGLFDEWPDPSGPPPMPTDLPTPPGNLNFGGGGMFMGGTGGMSMSAGLIFGGGNVCSYKTVCGLIGYGFAAGFGPELGVGIGQLCSGTTRSVGSFVVGGEGIIGGVSGSGSGDDLTAGIGLAGPGGGAAGGLMACVTELSCLNPCPKCNEGK